MNNLFEIPKEEGGGIYAIYNKDKFKMYIGQTKKLKQRAIFHKTQLLHGRHSNKGLQADAKDRFEFMVIYHAKDSDNLMYLEKLYIIQALKMGIPLYNTPPVEHKDSALYYSDLFVDSVLFDINAQTNINTTFLENIGNYPNSIKHALFTKKSKPPQKWA